MMKRMSFSETIFLFFLALIIFGPKKLPEIARQVGKYMNEFKRASNEFKAQIEQEIAHLEVEKPTILPPSPPPKGATSRTLNPAPSVGQLHRSPAPAAAGNVGGFRRRAPLCDQGCGSELRPPSPRVRPPPPKRPPILKT